MHAKREKSSKRRKTPAPARRAKAQQESWRASVQVSTRPQEIIGPVTSMEAYMRRIAGVPLLTRESEVDLARRIEEGNRQMVDVVLGTNIALEEIHQMGSKMRRGAVQLQEVVDLPEDHGALLEATTSHFAALLRLCAGISRAERELRQRRLSRGRRARLRSLVQAKRA